MKITDVRAYPLGVPFKKGDLPAPVRDWSTMVIVKVTTDEGVVGAGQAFGVIGAVVIAKAIESGLRPMLIGKDPLEIRKLQEYMYRMTYYYGRAGVMLCAISGVEIALWDIAGKVKNTPVYQLLGGRAHEKMRAYASLQRYPKPEDAARSCSMLAERGFTALKLHEIDVAAVAAARAAVGDGIDLMLDANGPWDVQAAIKIGRQLEPFNLYWFEEPVWPPEDYDGTGEVRAALNMPIAVGENEYTVRGFDNLISRRIVDFIQPSVFKVGGILEEKKVFTLANLAGVRVAPHGYSWGPSLAATLHVSFSEPGCELIETSVESPVMDIITEPLLPKNGYWQLSDKPGLGIELNEAALKKYTIESDFEVPFWLR